MNLSVSFTFIVLCFFVISSEAKKESPYYQVAQAVKQYYNAILEWNRYVGYTRQQIELYNRNIEQKIANYRRRRNNGSEYQLRTLLPSSNTTNETLPTNIDETILVPVEEIVFRTSANLQSFFDPSASQANVNFVTSPLTLVNMLAELLIGTSGRQHHILAYFLQTTNPRAKRSIRIFEFNNDTTSLFDPGDHNAKVNFTISPLTSVSMLAELLIGTHGMQHQSISKFLQLNKSKVKRDIQIFQFTNDTMFDEKLYHSAFHWKMRKLMSDVVSDKNYEAILKNTLIYNSEFRVTRHFRDNTKDFYQMEFVDRKDIDTKLADEQYGNVVDRLRKYNMNGPRILLFSNFNLKFEWDFNFSETTKMEVFHVKPYEEVDIIYWNGLIKDTVYVEENDFTMVALPFKGKTATMYVLLPIIDEFNIRRFSERLLGFDFFKSLKNNKTRPQDVQVTLPKIFPMSRVMDLTSPVVTQLLHEKAVYLNTVSKQLKVKHLVTHLSVSVKNGKAEKTEDKSETGNSTVQIKTFNADRPFVYIIMHEKTNMVMVWGSVSDPSIRK